MIRSVNIPLLCRCCDVDVVAQKMEGKDKDSCVARGDSVQLFPLPTRNREAATILAPKLFYFSPRANLYVLTRRNVTTYQLRATSDNEMASVLKRKRGSAQGVETLKRAKATTDVLEDAPTSVWDAAFAPVKQNNELATVNGDDDKLESSDAEDFEQFTQKEETEKKARKLSKSKAFKSKISDWRVSAPIGGRMIDVDPLFTEGEK